MISNSGHDENGKYSGGAAGDQTGGEWQKIKWYNRPWNVVLRYPDNAVGLTIATLAAEAAENNLIGYDQTQRGTFWQALKAAGYYPALIKTLCESDCSAGVAAIVKASGYILNIGKLQTVSPDMYTGNEQAALTNAGFKALTDSKYLTSDAYLLPGDILLYSGHHTAINLDTGNKMTITNNDIKNSVANIARRAKAEKWHYGDCKKNPPCPPIACERGIDRALWDLSEKYRDQQQGGETTYTIDAWLVKHGFEKNTDIDKVKPNSIVFMKWIGSNSFDWRDHVFYCTAYNPTLGRCNKYDFGDQWRIDAGSYFTNVPFNEWTNTTHKRRFYASYRLPEKSAPTPDDYYAYNEDYYRMAYPDVVAAYGKASLKKHYDLFGKREGRAANCILTPDYYKEHYKDLRAAFGENWPKYIDHFTSYGVTEGRRGSIVFDPAFYKKKYKDLANAFGNDKIKYYRHFLTYGMKEGRQGSADFDPRAYRKRYKDLDKAYGDKWPLYYRHYLIYGIKEHRKGV